MRFCTCNTHRNRMSQILTVSHINVFEMSKWVRRKEGFGIIGVIWQTGC